MSDLVKAFVMLTALLGADGALGVVIPVSTPGELADAIRAAAAGDTILLGDGSYGDLIISGRDHDAAVIIVPAAGSSAVFSSVRIDNSRNWTLRRLVVSPRFASGADGKIALHLSGRNLSIVDSAINYSDDISNWTPAEWVAQTGNGIVASGSYLTIKNNVISNVDHGVIVSAPDSLISENQVVNFRGDGIRGLADRAVYEYNLVKEAYDVDNNHDDGFQSWSNGAAGVGSGEVRDVTLRGNAFISHEDSGRPHVGALQGIGLFDGMFVNWRIENNLVVTNHWHGISVYGARNCTVVNNTVIDTDLSDPGPPWIMITDHKNGKASIGSVVRNNLTTGIRVGKEATEDHNIVVQALIITSTKTQLCAEI